MAEHNGSIRQRQDETDERYLKRLYHITFSDDESDTRKEAAMVMINKKLSELFCEEDA